MLKPAHNRPNTLKRTLQDAQTGPWAIDRVHQAHSTAGSRYRRADPGHHRAMKPERQSASPTTSPSSIIEPMLLIAHRGGSGEAPENTLAAFELAFRGQADGVEADVRLTADGVPVIIHDTRFDRTAHQPGRVSETAYADLPELLVDSWRDLNFPSERPPRLDEVVRWSADNRVLLRLHCKGPEAEIANLVRLTTQILWGVGDGAAPAEVMSSSPAALSAVRLTHPGVRTGLVVSNHVADPVGRAIAGHVEWVHLPWAAATDTIVQRSHDASVAVDAWTVNDTATAKAMACLGVDSIETDFPVAIRDAMSEAL
jgi:glycerophosphoryl diester phosphodiesterase